MLRIFFPVYFLSAWIKKTAKRTSFEPLKTKKPYSHNSRKKNLSMFNTFSALWFFPRKIQKSVLDKIRSSLLLRSFFILLFIPSFHFDYNNIYILKYSIFFLFFFTSHKSLALCSTSTPLRLFGSTPVLYFETRL